MQRSGVLLVIAGVFLLGLTAPAYASPPVFKSKMTTAEAFWHSEQVTGANTFTDTTWYVGVFAGFDGMVQYSDLYQDVEDCTADSTGNVSCTEVSSKFGDTQFPPGTTIFSFTMDTSGLTSAHLDGTYQLQSFDQNGNPVGSPESDHIVADWTGMGPIAKTHSKFSFHQKCIHFQATDKGRTRAADATGTLNGTPLGTTSDTFFGGDATLQVDHSC